MDIDPISGAALGAQILLTVPRPLYRLDLRRRLLGEKFDLKEDQLAVTPRPHRASWHRKPPDTDADNRRKCDQPQSLRTESFHRTPPTPPSPLHNTSLASSRPALNRIAAVAPQR